MFSFWMVLSSIYLFASFRRSALTNFVWSEFPRFFSAVHFLSSIGLDINSIYIRWQHPTPCSSLQNALSVSVFVSLDIPLAEWALDEGEERFHLPNNLFMSRLNTFPRSTILFSNVNQPEK